MQVIERRSADISWSWLAWEPLKRYGLGLAERSDSEKSNVEMRVVPSRRGVRSGTLLGDILQFVEQLLGLS